MIRTIRRRNRQRRARILASTALLAGTIAGVNALGSPAASADPANPRQRDASSRWAPSAMQVSVADISHSGDDVTEARWKLFWDSDPRRSATLRANFEANRAFRAKMQAPAGGVYIDDYYDSEPEQNLPQAAGFFLMSRFLDNEFDTYGWGVTRADFLDNAVAYDVALDLYRDGANGNTHQVGWVVDAAFQKDLGCVGGVANCTFGDYFLGAVRKQDFQVTQTGQNSSKTYNWKHSVVGGNFDFEDANNAGTLAGWSWTPAATVSTVCGGAFDSDCYAWLRSNNNNADRILSVATNHAPKATDNLTGEAAIRCTNASGCQGRISYRAGSEWRSEPFSLPGDWDWYMCRVDFNHGANAGLANNQAAVQLEIQLTGNASLDVDYATLSPSYYNFYQGTVGDGLFPPQAPNAGADCVSSSANVFFNNG